MTKPCPECLGSGKVWKELAEVSCPLCDGTGYEQLQLQLMPPLNASDYQSLKEDIALRGVQVPVEYDEAGTIIDGHHRVRICQELGIADWPRIVRQYADDAARRTQARKLNIARRHLDQAAKRMLVEDELRDRPGSSNRQIASGLGVDHKTVDSVRSGLEGRGEIPHVEKRVDSKGRKQPAQKPKTVDILLPGKDGEEAVSRSAKGYREYRNARKRAEKLAASEALSSRNTSLPSDERRYGVIYADPPWSFQVWSGEGKDRAAENHYPTMTQTEIEALPVADMAADDCALFMWAVMPQLPEALSVIKAWGFEYKTCAFVWVKQTKDEERFATGMGYWTRANAELCLLATRGSPQRLNADVHQVVLSPRVEHSRKPDDVAARIERLVPGPYIELFSRRQREGWDAWGNQAEGVAA